MLSSWVFESPEYLFWFPPRRKFWPFWSLSRFLLNFSSFLFGEDDLKWCIYGLGRKAPGINLCLEKLVLLSYLLFSNVGEFEPRLVEDVTQVAQVRRLFFLEVEGEFLNFVSNSSTPRMTANTSSEVLQLFRFETQEFMLVSHDLWKSR
ncbi:hypothetical protein TNCV_42121 [Trichonephila clavipes]|nr:hypothetical protein TNCV_42121 [Trichonephila clavipes]